MNQATELLETGTASRAGTASSEVEDQSLLHRVRRMLAGRSFRTLAAVYGVLVLLVLSSGFINPSADVFNLLKTVIGLATFTAVVAFGQYLVILVGGLDLSIPSVMTLSGVMLTGVSLGSNEGALVAVPVALIIGGIVGLINGFGILFLRISPVVMTLGVNVILSGVVLVYTDGTPSGTSPPFITSLVQGNSVAGIPNIILILVCFSVVAISLVNRTSFGRQLYAVGSNRRVAYLSGIHVTRVTLLVYVRSGVAAAIGGMLLVGYSGQSYLTLGDPYLLLSLAAVVLGGVSIAGGRGLYAGVLGGALILTMISSILAGTALPQSVRQIVYALVIIVAVLGARQKAED